MTSTSIATGVRWRFRATCPPDWARRLEQCGGGFFHSPPGLTASGIEGEPCFGELVDGDDVVGIVAGIWRRCRVPPRPRHAHLPSPPALAPGAETLRPRAIELLVDSAEALGWADLTVDSLEADGAVEPGATGISLPGRLEYDLPLSGSPDDLTARLSAHHLRRLPKPAAGWTLGTLSGADARALMVEVTGAAVARASARRGVTYAVGLPPAAAFREDPAWGLTTYAALDGGRPLSAALVGWAGKRAYYVSGGSTPDGYARNASVWLHLQVALAFQSAGFTHYCLGGTPATASDPADPSHGLHRFKTGFGAQARPCAGAHWVFAAEHEAGHRLTRWIRDHLPPFKESA